MKTAKSAEKNNCTSKVVYKILVIFAGIILLFIAVTLVFTPFFMVQPNFNEKAHDQVSALENVQAITINPKEVYFSNADAEICKFLPENLTGWLLKNPEKADKSEVFNNTSKEVYQFSNASDGVNITNNFETSNSSDNSSQFAYANSLIIYFGGIDEDSSTAILRFAGQMENGYIKGYDIACIDWPGYGKNEGSATDESLRACAQTVVRYFATQSIITSNSPNTSGQSTESNSLVSAYDKIVILGYSMGTGPATYAAATEGCGQLILVAPYASSTDLYNNVTPVFYGPMEWLLTYKMETADYASDYNGAALIIACEDDTRVPYESSVKLSKSFPDEIIYISKSESSSDYMKTHGFSDLTDGNIFYTLSDINHGDMMDSAEVLEILSIELSF